MNDQHERQAAASHRQRLRRLFRLEGDGRRDAARAQILSLLPSGIDTFYKVALDHPDLAPHFAESDIDRLKGKQAEHWGNLLREERFENALGDAERVGRIHADREIVPSDYMAGYAVILEDLILRLIDGKLKPAARADAIGLLIRSCFADMAASITTYTSSVEDSTAQDRLLAMSDSLEREMSVTLTEVGHQVTTLAQLAKRLDGAAGDVDRSTGQLSGSADGMRHSVNTVAGAAEELEASSQEITAQAESASEQVGRTQSDVTRAKEAMERLDEAAQAIGDVTGLVQRIAAQTRMLALNATIEAARAGEAGRGFAVVANEVKSLAAETEKAISSVSVRTEQIGGATRDVDGALEQIVASIVDLSERAGTIAASAAEQRSATGEIARSAQQASSETTQVAEELQNVQEVARLSSQTSDRLTDISDRLTRDVADLQRRVTIMLRDSDAGNRRRAHRVPLGVSAVLTVRGQAHRGHLIDLSETGGLFHPGIGVEEVGGWEGTIEFGKIGAVPVELISGSGLGTHLRFSRPPRQAVAEIAALMARIEDEDRPLAELSKEGAETIQTALRKALASGRISREALFDDHYVPIEGTNPQQFRTEFLPLVDELLPPVQEPILQRHPGIVFCAAVDRNAYLPTHNMVYSKPQRPDDPIWNAANSRNRRIFDDRAGLLAARNQRPGMVQAYVRDMGGGKVQVLKEVDSPIEIDGRIWGNLRLAYRQETG